MQAAVLPKPYQNAFANIFDAAPPCTYQEIESVFIKDFGKPPQDVYDHFDRESIAAASIAQVHRATKGDKVFAVKIQRPQIEKQIDWWAACNLFSYKSFRAEIYSPGIYFATKPCFIPMKKRSTSLVPLLQIVSGYAEQISSKN